MSQGSAATIELDIIAKANLARSAPTLLLELLFRGGEMTAQGFMAVCETVDIGALVTVELYLVGFDVTTTISTVSLPVTSENCMSMV